MTFASIIPFCLFKYFETLNQDTKRLENWEFVYINKDGTKDTSKNYKEVTTGSGSNEQQQLPSFSVLIVLSILK